MLARQQRILSSVLLGWLLSSCSATSLPLWSSGYEPPAAPKLGTWEGAESVAPFPTDAAADQALPVPQLAPTAWLTLFESDALNQLAQRLLARNWSLQQISARIIEARALRSISAADFYPGIELGGSITRGRTGSVIEDASGATSSGFAPVSSATTTRYQALGSLAWELDLFGGTRRAFEAAVAEVQAEEESLSAARLELLATLAEQYVELLASQQAILIAERNASLQRESLELVSARYTAGLTGELDQAQASAQLETTLATLPRLRSQREAALSALITLLSPPLEELPATRSELESLAARALPALPPTLFGPQPAELLRARPDVRRAERLLAASAARSAEAVADYFPRVTLGARLGYRNQSSDDLFTSDSEFWDLAPAVSWPLFSGGRLSAQVEVREAQQAQRYAEYQATVLQAINEAQTALFQLQQAKARKAALEKSVQAQRRAHQLAREQYEQGLVDFQRVLDAELRVFVNEQSLLEAQQNELARFIFAIKALGAGGALGKNTR